MLATSFILIDGTLDSSTRKISRKMITRYSQGLYSGLDSPLVSCVASAWPVLCSRTYWQDVPAGDEAMDAVQTRSVIDQSYGLLGAFCVP